MTLLWRTEEILAQLIAHPTVSSDPNLAMMDDMANLLDAAGAQVELFHDASGTKANMFATLGPDTSGGIVLSGHSDVVPVTDQDWTCEPFKLSEQEDALYGRGSCDMKGFIAATLALAETVAPQSLRRPLHFCYTYDEEVGCFGAQALMPELQKRADCPSMAIVGEPTDMQIIEGHKGCCEYTTRFRGREGHGSTPDAGVNAVAYAARYATRLMELAHALKSRAPVKSRFDPPWTTINIGALNGGVAHNVIPGKASLAWEMRPVQPSDVGFVKDALAAYVDFELLPAMRIVCPDANIATEVIAELAGLEPMDDNLARDLIAGLTGQNTADVVPFGTEAGLFQGIGLAVVVCGPGSIAQAHKPDEFVTRTQLGRCLTMLRGVADSL